ncbi:MAG: helix-turn-helix domain-containing protein [Acidimicrobiia bacterium]
MSAAPGTTTVPTRDRIVEAALRLFAERGTTAVSMRELADAAGVTVPGLYYHFASKAELIREVYRAQGFGKEPGEIELPAPAPVEAIIVAEARREFTRFIGQREFLSLMQGEAVLGDEDALEVGLTLAALWRARWVAVLGCATDAAPDADLDAAADCIATFLWGLFVEYLRRDTKTEDHRIEQFARLVAPALRGTSV